MKFLVFLFPILTMGCVNLDEMTDEQRTEYLQAEEDKAYYKQEALIEAKFLHARKEVICKRAGGFMIIPRESARTIKNGTRETAADYKNSQCALW